MGPLHLSIWKAPRARPGSAPIEGMGRGAVK